ncbi:MAG: exo-alpha-sialidase [Candidatus Hydrogenedentes bacterium]|nr:exo-alpha-sialidase [Candidatus Hydrogenedentota bacterium]
MFHSEGQHLSSHKGVLATLALSICLVLLPAQAMAQFVVFPTFPVHSNATSDSGEDAFARIATDGAGNWVAVWESDENLGGTIGPDSDILVALSSTNGATWGAPAVLNTNATGDTGGDFNVHIQTDGAGVWIATWESNEDVGAAISTDFDILFSRSTNNGVTWSAPAALNTNATTDTGGDFRPLTVSAGAGVWVAVWESDDDLSGTIGTDSDILFSRSTDNGATWSAPAPLNDNAVIDTGNDGFVSVTSDGGANWVAVWESNQNLGGAIGTDIDIFVSTSSDTGATWSSTVRLNTNAATDTGNDLSPVVATDTAGNWVVVWHSLEENVLDAFGSVINVGIDSDILVSRSADNGNSWTAPQALNINASIDTGQDQNPVITVDSVGNWTVAWDSTDDLGRTVGTDSDIFGAVSTNNGLNWTFPKAINADAATDTGFDNDEFPSIGIKGDASLVYVWHSDANLDIGGAIGTDSDILYANAFIFFPSAEPLGGCFIATAAYGTPLDARLDALREFRDGTLLANTLGSAFVDTYYRVSPVLADRVAENPAFAAVTRLFLTPIVALVSVFGAHPNGIAILFVCTFASALLLIRRRLRSLTQ